MSEKFILKKYSSEYKEQVINLLQDLWLFDKRKRLDYFHWKFEDNPYVTEPLAFIVLDGKKVVAFKGYMVQPFVFHSYSFLAAAVGDTITHKNYRKRGLARSLTEYSVSEISKMDHILLCYNSSSGGPTLKGFLDLHWIPFFKRENFFRFSLTGFLKSLFNVKENSYIAINNTKDGIIEITNEMRPHDIICVPYDRNTITHERSYIYYSWRLRNPMSEYIYCYKYDKLGVLRAYIVLKKIQYRRFDIVDYNSFVEEDLEQLLSFFVRKTSPLYILYWTGNLNSVFYKENLKFKFLPVNLILREIKKFEKPPFLIYPLMRADIDIPIKDFRQWNLFKIIGDEI